MALYKRGIWYWMDAVVNGYRYRERLGTTDSRKAPGLERDRIAQLKDKAPDPTRKSKAIGALTIAEAVERYVSDRSSQVSKRMVSYWREQAKPLGRSFLVFPCFDFLLRSADNLQINQAFLPRGEEKR